MSLSASKYINSGKKGNFVGLSHYSRPMRGKHSVALDIYGLFTVRSEARVNCSQIAKFAWDGVVDGFEYSNEDSYNEALKGGIKESVRRIKQLIVNDPEIGEMGVDVNFSLFVFSDKGVYVGLLGDMDILLYKGGKIVDVSDMLKSKKAHTAALVFDDVDLLLTSGDSTLDKNMNRLMGLPDKDAIQSRVKNLGKVVSEGEGIVLFESEVKERVSIKDKVFKKRVDDKEEVVEDPTFDDIPEDLVEPSSSDYVGTDRVEVQKDLLDVKGERDLRSVLKGVVGVLSVVFVFISKYLKIVWRFLKRVFGKLFSGLGVWFGKLLVVLKERFGRKRWFKKFSARVSQSGVGKREFKEFKVDGYKEKSVRGKRFRVVFIVIAVVVLLVVGVNFTLKQREANAIHKEAVAVLDVVEGLVVDAEGKVNTDRDETEMLLFRALEEFNKLPEGMNEGDVSIKDGLESRVLKIQDDMYKRVGVGEDLGNFDTYLDTRLGLGEGSEPTDIAMYVDDSGNEYLLISDSGLKGVYRVSLYNKEVKKLPDNDGVISDPQRVTVGNDGVFVLDMDKGVVRAGFDDSGWFSAFEELSSLGNNSLGLDDMSEFAVLTESDNVYILDREKAALYKSSNYGSGYGLSYSYISDDSFSTANDVMADLSVYILHEGSDGLRRYNYSYVEQKQVEAPLEVLGLNGDFEGLSYGYTRGSLQYGLYLFDSVSKRFMRFEKPVEGGGEVLHPNQVVLKSQFVYRGDRDGVFGSVHDFVVDGDEEFMYVLDGSAVWRVRL